MTLTFFRRSVGVEVHKSANTDYDQGASHRYIAQQITDSDVSTYSLTNKPFIFAHVVHFNPFNVTFLFQFGGRRSC